MLAGCPGEHRHDAAYPGVEIGFPYADFSMPFAITVARSIGAIFIAVATLAGCVTERAEQHSAPPGSFGMGGARFEVEVSVDMNTRLSGSATEETLLWFITLKRPKNYAVNVRYSDDGTTISFLNALFGGAAERMKAAAAYNAAYGKADIIVAPQWAVEVEDYIIFTRTTARVTGYAGTIEEIYQDPRELKEFRFRSAAIGSGPVSDPGRSSTPAAGAPSSSMSDLTVGEGSAARPGDIVAYHYRCTLPDGTIVFDSRNRRQLSERVAGAPTTPPGLTNALVGVRRGGHRRVALAPDQAYGAEGLAAWNIPPNSAVTFDLYIDDVATDR